MLRRPIKQGANNGGSSGRPKGTTTRNPTNSALPLHHHGGGIGGRKVLPHGVAPAKPPSSSSTRSHVLWYLFQMVILVGLGSSLIVMIHAVTHRDIPSAAVVEDGREVPVKVRPLGDPVGRIGDSLQNRRQQQQIKPIPEFKQEPKPEPKKETNPKPKPKAEPKPKPKPKAEPIPQARRRTTAEANEYMRSQPSTAVDGEKYIKQQLSELQKIQSTGAKIETKALIATRFVGYDRITDGEGGGREKIRYWISNDRSDVERSRWQEEMEALNLEKKEEDKVLFPSLFGERVGGVEKKKKHYPMFAKELIVHVDKAAVTKHEKKVAEGRSEEIGKEEQVGGQIQAKHVDGIEIEKDKIVEKEMEGDRAQVVKTDDGVTPPKQPKIEFPSPAFNPKFPSSNVILRPTIGSHRRTSDAIFAFAEGYDLKIYLSFIESLKATGFTGDLVLSVSALGSLKDGVEEYLRSHAAVGGKEDAKEVEKKDDYDDDDKVEERLHVVVYTVKWNCFTGEGKLADGPNEGQRKCALVGMYGDDERTPIPDIRDPRPVATARYELYWAWSLNYDAHRWIMLIDSRDTYFQMDPFDEIVRETREIGAGEDDEGTLYFFAENADASKIGESKFNKGWLEKAYGTDNVSPYFDKPIICSGSTMGETIAIESYLRVMVAQFDDTNCKMKGCDQGFHNYLHYSGALDTAKGIREVKVFEQGQGIINNLALLRSKSLKEWGLLNSDMGVLNWNGSVSYVAHQFDRDDELNQFVKGKRKAFMSDWAKRRDKK